MNANKMKLCNDKAYKKISEYSQWVAQKFIKF